MKQGWKRHAGRPLSAAGYRSSGARFMSEGRPGQAVVALCKAVEMEPRDAVALRMLGSALLGMGHHSEAGNAFEQSLRLNPVSAEAWCELGNLHHMGGRLAQASWAYTQALELEPANARAHYNLGVTRLLQNRGEEALMCFTSAALADPLYADAHNNRGILLQLAGDLDGSIQSYRQALGANPHDLRAGYNLGLALQNSGKLEEAAEAYHRVLCADPANASAHNNFGNVLMALGRLPEAIHHYQQAHRHDAAHLEAPWNLGVARLLTGDFKRGWEGYEYRLLQPGATRRQFVEPRWMGQLLEGRRIFLYAEQGLGDTIQFSRFVPALSSQGATVFLECQPAVRKLMQNLPGVSEVFTLTAEGAPELPEFDYQTPLMSVCYALGTTLETIPAEVPYVCPSPPVVEEWRRVMAGYDAGRRRRRVGLAWAGNPRHLNDANRSLALARLAGLLELEGPLFFSLQKGPAAAQLGEVARGRVHDLAPRLTDLEQTAAAMLELDLVISVDTVVAHLAGALGRPVWLMLPFAPDWRWMLEREDSPWYPTMRIFRQSGRGDWAPVVEAMRARLAPAIEP
jgi:tetratricopeptide (TPR) repeat protein